jgi:hypothetical protein
MATPQLLNDIISVLLLLAPSAALLSLVIAGVNLRREGTMTFAIGGGFTKWMFWAVVFLTLQPLLSWFTSFGVPVPLPSGGIATGWLANLQADVAQFVANFVVQRLVPTLAAFFVLRAILDAASGQHPLPSILAAMFLLGTQTTYNLLQSYNTGTQYPLPACCLLIACSGVVVTIRILNEMRLDYSPIHAGFAYKTTEQLRHSRALLRCIACSRDDAVLVAVVCSFRIGVPAIARNYARASCTRWCGDTRGLCALQWCWAMNIPCYRSSGPALYCARIHERWWGRLSPMVVTYTLVVAEPCAWAGARRVAR